MATSAKATVCMLKAATTTLQTFLELLLLKIRFLGSFITHLNCFNCLQKNNNHKDYFRCSCNRLARICAEFGVFAVFALWETHIYRLLPVHPITPVVLRQVQVSVFIERRHNLTHGNVCCLFICPITYSSDLIAHFFAP